MSKNSVIGFILVGIILIASMFYNAKHQPIPKKKTKSDSTLVKKDKEKQKVAVDPTEIDSSEIVRVDTLQNKIDSTHQENDSLESNQAKSSDIFSKFKKGEKQELVLANDLLRIKISTLGGGISFVQLKKYKNYSKTELEMVKNINDNRISYEFFHRNQRFSTSKMFFSPEGVSNEDITSDSHSVSMILKIDEDKYIEQIYTLKPNSYVVGYSVKWIGFDEVIPTNMSSLRVNWETKILQHEKSLEQERKMSNIWYKYSLESEDPDDIGIGKDKKEELVGKVKWISFTQQFFARTLIANESIEDVTIESVRKGANKYVKTVKTNYSLPFKHRKEEKYDFQIYYGPIDYGELKKLGYKTKEQLNLGWGIFGWFNKILVIPIFNWLSSMGLINYGLIILLMTVIIKMLLLIFTYRSYISTAKMRILKPEIEAIKAKHGKDAAKNQSETMKLYRKAGVSPLGGCLPMLLQMPILIALFRFFPSSIDLRQKSFLWADDLSTYDSIWTFDGFSIPFYGDHVSLFTLLMTITTVLYTRMNSSNMGASGDAAKQMKIISYIMPILFLGFFNNYAAALSYYYFLANMFTFGQTYLFRRFVNEEKLRAKIEENKKKNKGKEKSKFQQRLEKLAKEQESKRKKR